MTHLYSLRGTWWADWLARTGRAGPARALTARNADICRENGWNDDLARCDRMLGRLALAAGDTAAAGEHLAAAAGCFRDGDYLTELAVTLADLAGHAQAGRGPGRRRPVCDRGDHHRRPPRPGARPLRRAGRPRPHPRRPGHRRRDPDLMLQGRDAADAALRLATRHHWPGTNSTPCAPTPPSTTPRASTTGGPPKPGPARPAGPAGLDPDPLATVEGLAAARNANPAADHDEDGES